MCLSLNACQFTVFEENGEFFFLNTILSLKGVNIVPAVVSKYIHDQWRTHQKYHLFFGDPRLKLGDGIRVYDVALLNIHAVNTAGGQRKACQNGYRNEKLSHMHFDLDCKTAILHLNV